MSSPGFNGAGPSEFFAGASGFPGQSAAAPPHPNGINTTTPITIHPSHPLYRTQQQLPQIFLDPSSSTPQRQNPPSAFNGKRTLAEFQSYQNLNYSHNNNNNNNHNPLLNNNNNNNPNQYLNNLLLRSVKQRTLSPMDFSIPSGFPSPQHRYGVPILNNLRPNPNPNPISLANYSILQNTNRSIPFQNPGLPHLDNNRRAAIINAQEKQIMDNRLLELEKELLEDNDDDVEADSVSVITNSEWSDTIQSLIRPPPAQAHAQAQAQAQLQAQKFASLSPTSSTTSSNSSSCSVVSPECSRQSLIEAATAISDGNLEAASEILTRLAQLSNPMGNSDQRLVNCMVSALRSRLNQAENPPPVAELFSREHAESTQLLLENCLCFKLAFIAANHAILEALIEEKAADGDGGIRLCVVDFDVGNGKQYASLLHLLAARRGGKPATLRIAAVAENGVDERLKIVGELLGLQAERLGIGFHFKVVWSQDELTRESLGCDSEEILAVNFAFKLYRMPDESVSTENPRDELLRRVKALAPRVVTLVEQEMNVNTAPLVARVAELCSYYGALFESVESTMARDNSVRVKVEEGLNRRIGNSVACEGRDRVERCEVFGKWRMRMGMAGFKLKPASQSVAESFTTRLGPGHRVTVKEENGSICFSWMGRTLTVASTWR